MHFEDFVTQEHAKIIQLARQYGAIVIQGMDIKEVGDQQKFPFRPVSNRTSSLVPWHYDRNYSGDGRKLSAVVLGHKESDEPRPIPTLVAPTSLIATLLRAEIRAELGKERLPESLRGYYSGIVSLPDQYLLDSINDGFDEISLEIRSPLIELLRKVEKSHPSFILSHNWRGNHGSILIINTEEEPTSETCRVSHARIFDPTEFIDPNDPMHGEYYLERAFIYE